MEVGYIPKIGDKVIITKSEQNWAVPEMDAFVGKILTVKDVYVDSGEHCVKFVEKYNHLNSWTWCYEHGHFKKWKPDPSERKELKLKFKF